MVCASLKVIGVKKWKTKIRALMCHFLPFPVTFFLPHYAVSQIRAAHRPQSGLKCVLLPRPQILWSLALYSGIGPFLWWEESSIGNEGKSTRRREAAIKSSMERSGGESCLASLDKAVNVCICCWTPCYEGKSSFILCSRQTGIKDILVICDYSSRYLLSCFLWRNGVIKKRLATQRRFLEEASVRLDMAEDIRRREQLISLQCHWVRCAGNWGIWWDYGHPVSSLSL